MVRCCKVHRPFDVLRCHSRTWLTRRRTAPGAELLQLRQFRFRKRDARPSGFGSVLTKEVPLVWRVSSPDTIIEAISHGPVRAAGVFNRNSAESHAKIKKKLH